MMMNHERSYYPTAGGDSGNARRTTSAVDVETTNTQQQEGRRQHLHAPHRSTCTTGSSIIDDLSTREYYRRLAVSYLVIPIVLASIPFLIHVCMTILYALSGVSRVARTSSGLLYYFIWMGLMGIVFMVTKHTSRYLIITYAPTPEICDKTLERTCDSFTSSIKRICWSSLMLRFVVYPIIRTFLLSSAEQQPQLLLWNQFWKCAFDTTIPFGGCMFVSFMMVSVMGYIKHCSRRFSLVKCSLHPLSNNPYTSQIPILLNSWNKFNREWNTIQHTNPFVAKNSPMGSASNPRTTNTDTTTTSALVARQTTGGPLVPAHSPFVSTQERRSPRTGGSSTGSATTPFSLFKTQPSSSSPMQRLPIPGTTRTTPIDARTRHGVASSPAAEIINNGRNSSTYNDSQATYPPLGMALFYLIIYMVCGAIFGVALRNAIGLILVVPIATWMKTSMAFVGALCFACVWCQEYLLFSTENTTPFEINPSQYPKYQYVPPSTKKLNVTSNQTRNNANGNGSNSVGTFLRTNFVEKVLIDLKQFMMECHPLWWKRLIILMLTGSPLIGAWMFYFVLPTWTTSYDDATIDNHHGEEEVSSMIQQWCPTKLYFLMSSVLCPSVSTTMMTLLEILMGYIIFMTGITYMRMIDTINHIAICQPMSLTALSQVEQEQQYRRNGSNTNQNTMERQSPPTAGGTILPTSLMESFDYLPSHIKFFLRLMCDLDITTTSVSYVSRSRGSPMSPSSLSLYDANQTSKEAIIHYLLMDSHCMTHGGIDSLEAKELQICNDLIHSLTECSSLMCAIRNNNTSRNVMKLLVLESFGGLVNDAKTEVVSTTLPAASLRHQQTIEHMLQNKHGSLAIVRTLIAMATMSIHDMEDIIESTIQTTKLISNSNNDVVLLQQQLCVSPGQMYQMEMCVRGAARMIGTVLVQSSSTSSSKQDYSSSVGRHSMVSLCLLPLMKVAHKLHVTTLQLINELIALQQVELNISSSGSDDNDNGRNPASTRQQQQQQQLIASKVITTIAQTDSTGLYHTFCLMELENPQLMNMLVSLSSSDIGMSLLKLLVVSDEGAYLIWTRLQSTNDVSKQERILKQLTPECQRWLHDLLQRVKKE